KLIKIGELIKGQSYPINRDYGNWHEIKFGNYYGYVHKNGTAPNTGSSIQNKNITFSNTSRVVNLIRDTPVYDNSTGKLVEFGKINRNVKIALLSDYGNWWRILFGDRVGYISKSTTQIDFTKSDKYFKAEEDLSVYDNRTGKLVQIGK